MEKHFRFGMLASLALHIVPVGIWWAQSPVFQPASAASPSERVIEIHLASGRRRAQGAEDVSEGQPAAAETAGPQSEPVNVNVAAGEQGAQSPESGALPIVPVLPAREQPYIPAGELDARPYPQSPVVVPFPDAPLQKTKVTGVLVLYIGADGRVDRIEVDQSDLPPAFEQVAIETFLQAQMQPGIKAGQPTRARMKVLVEFEAR